MCFCINECRFYWNFLKYFPEPWWIMPITSPFRLKFLKFFQIRYLESQNVLTKPVRSNASLHKPYRDSFLIYWTWTLGTKPHCKREETPKRKRRSRRLRLRDTERSKSCKYLRSDSAAVSCRLSIVRLNLDSLATLKYSTQIPAYVIFTS